MSWVATAVVGGAVIGAVSSGFAANKSAKSANAATAASERSSAQQAQLAQDNLEFQKAQYADWQDIYGPIQENLSNFFQDLTPDALVASGLKTYEIQHGEALTSINRSFAQRGVDSSAQDSILASDKLRTAEFKATLRNDAPLRVATAKQGFLNQNVNNPATSGISNALTNQSNVFGTLANRQQGTADRFNADAAAGYSGVGRAVQGGVQSYTQFQQVQNLQNAQVQPQTPIFAGSPQRPATADLIV